MNGEWEAVIDKIKMESPCESCSPSSHVRVNDDNVSSKWMSPNNTNMSIDVYRIYPQFNVTTKKNTSSNYGETGFILINQTYAEINKTMDQITVSNKSQIKSNIEKRSVMDNGHSYLHIERDDDDDLYNIDQKQNIHQLDTNYL